MRQGDVTAVVVTFHPDEDALRNLVTLRAQVAMVVVVDNGSSVEELLTLRATCCKPGLELIENGRNLGIAAGLNAGLRRVLEEAKGRDGWVMLFDQDSCVTDGFGLAMLRGFEDSRWGGRLGLLVPRYVDQRFGRFLVPNRSPKGGLEVGMTSGSMLRLSLVREQGLFVEEMFIDCVDQEYCLRLRRAGYVIDECEEAVLLHAPGAPTVFEVFGWRFQAANYSPLRRYYQERNKLWIYRRYFRGFPRYCCRLMFASLKDGMKILLVERGKLQKMRYFALGLRDGLRGRMGPA